MKVYTSSCICAYLNNRRRSCLSGCSFSSYAEAVLFYISMADGESSSSLTPVTSLHVSLPIRKGRGSRRAEDHTFNDLPLRDRHEFLTSANSKSTQANVNLARKVLLKYAAKKGAPDPNVVTKDSSIFVLNLLADYCRFGRSDSLKNDSMSAIVQGLRLVYSEHGHYQTWSVDDNGNARGNPLVGNPDLDSLRRAHRVHLARYGVVTLKARPITVEHVCDMAERFWYGRDGETAICDVELHAVLVLGLNLGLRYDEISKLKAEHVSVGSGGETLTLCEAIKNSTVQRDYHLREWDGNTPLRNSIFMDPFLALYSRLTIRGSRPGPLFCDISEIGRAQY